MAMPTMLGKYGLLVGSGQRGPVSIKLGFCTDPWTPQRPLDLLSPFENEELDPSRYPRIAGSRWAALGFPTHSDASTAPFFVCEHVYGVQLKDIGDEQFEALLRARRLLADDCFSRPLPLRLGLFVLRRIIAALKEAHRPPSRPGVGLAGITLGWEGQVRFGSPPGWPIVGLESKRGDMIGDRARLGSLIAGLHSEIPADSKLAALAASSRRDPDHPPSLEEFLAATQALETGATPGEAELGEYLRDRFPGSCDRDVDELGFLATLTPESWMERSAERFLR